MKTAIVYASVHHGNTKKIIDEIAKTNDVELIDATQTVEKDLSEYDLIGFASGVYGGKFHQSVLKFASVNLTDNKNVFLISICAGIFRDKQFKRCFRRPHCYAAVLLGDAVLRRAVRSYADKGGVQGLFNTSGSDTADSYGGGIIFSLPQAYPEILHRQRYCSQCSCQRREDQI